MPELFPEYEYTPLKFNMLHLKINPFLWKPIHFQAPCFSCPLWNQLVSRVDNTTKQRRVVKFSHGHFRLKGLVTVVLEDSPKTSGNFADFCKRYKKGGWMKNWCQADCQVNIGKGSLFRSSSKHQGVESFWPPRRFVLALYRIVHGKEKHHKTKRVLKKKQQHQIPLGFFG